jgi:hypothetical protein
MTPAVCLSLAVLFVVFVNDIGDGFVTGSVICRLCQRLQRCVCHWQCYLSFLLTTPAVGLSLTVLIVVFVKTPTVGLSLAVLFVVFVKNTSSRFVTDSVICRPCQRQQQR